MITIVKVDNPEIILNNIDVNKNFGEYIRNSWSQLRQLYDVEWFEKVDLYRSDQEDVEFLWINYKFNFWFCGEMANCRIHNQHTFIEFHTCIAWDWFMQKFEVNDVNTLIETVWLMPWASHRTFNMEGENEENWNPKYPFHRWLGWKTWNIWLVIEKY